MPGGISRNLHGKAGRARSRASKAAPNRRRPRESPRGPSQGDGDGLRPETATRTGFIEEASALEKGSGRAARPSGGGAIRKGISTSFGFERFLRKGGTVSAQRLSRRATGKASASMRAFRRRTGFGRAGSREARVRTSVLPKRPDGDRRGASRPLCRDPPGAERGFTASLRDPGESEAGLRARLAIQSRPARDGLATQRRQSKLGQVGAGGDTGPHYDSRPPVRRIWRLFSQAVTALFFERRYKEQGADGFGGGGVYAAVWRNRWPSAGGHSIFLCLRAFSQKRVRTEPEIRLP